MTDDNTKKNDTAYDFSKFMKETLKKEEAKPKLDPMKPQQEQYNPNKEYFRKYHEGVAGRMWIGKPRYR